MKKLVVILLILFSFCANAQRVQYVNTYGYQYQRLLTDTLLNVPKDTFDVPDAYNKRFFVAAKGTTLYIWDTTNLRWSSVAGGDATTPTLQQASNVGNVTTRALIYNNSTISSGRNYYINVDSAGKFYANGWGAAVGHNSSNGEVFIQSTSASGTAGNTALWGTPPVWFKPDGTARFTSPTILMNDGSDSIASKAYARSVGGSGSAVGDGRGVDVNSTVLNLASRYRSQLSNADQSAYIPSLILTKVSETAQNVWRDGQYMVEINDTLFFPGGYHLFGSLGLNTDSIWYSVDGGKTSTLYDARLPYALANSAFIKARFPGDYNYIIGASFPETNTKRKTVFRFRDFHNIETMTTNAEWGVRSGQGAGQDEDGWLYVFGGAASTDTTTALQDVWRSKDGGATWTQIQTGLTWMGGELIDNVVYRDGFFYIINANNKYGNGNNAYGWKNYKISVINMEDETKWVRLDDSPAGVTRQIFISSELFRGNIWAGLGYNIANSNTDSVAYLDKYDKWHSFHKFYGIQKNVTSPADLPEVHAAALAEHRGSLYIGGGSGSNDVIILKDTSYLAPFYARNFVGVNRRTYMSEGLSGQGSIFGNGVIADPDANNQVIRKTTEDAIGLRMRYDLGAQFFILTGSNSTQNVGVASGTGFVGGVDASGIWRLSTNASYNPGSWGGRLRVEGSQYLSGNLRAPGLATTAIDTTTYKPIVVNSSGDVTKMNYWPVGGGGSGSGTINGGNSGDIPVYVASTTLDNTAPLRWDDDGTNAFMSVGTTTAKVQIGSRISGTPYPMITFGNVTPSFTNYQFLYGSSGETIFNTSTSHMDFRYQNTNLARFHGSGGFSWGLDNYITDPGINNAIIQGRLGIGFNSSPNYALVVGSSEDFQVTSAGKIRDYANGSPTNGQILIGHTANATFEKGTIGSSTLTVTNGAGAITIDVPTSFITSGTYTPTLTNVTNAASTAYQCQYMRVGDVITVSGKIDIDPTATGAVEVGVSLPIASGLGNDYEVGGTANSGAVAAESAAISGDGTNDRAAVKFIAVDVTNKSYFFSFTYRYIAP